MTSDETTDGVAEYLTRLYDGMTSRERRARLLLEYHCAAGRPCLLLRVFATDYGPAFYAPPYVLTPERNLERSTEEGRAANTTDGFNRWKGWCDLWIPAPDETHVGDEGEKPASWGLHCRHVDVAVPVADIDADLSRATAGVPVRRRIARVSPLGDRSVPLDSVSQVT